MVGYFIDAVIWNIADRNSLFTRCIQIDIVHANAVTNNDSRPRHQADGLGIESGKLGDHEVRLRQPGEQFSPIASLRVLPPLFPTVPKSVARYPNSETYSQ